MNNDSRCQRGRGRCTRETYECPLCGKQYNTCNWHSRVNDCEICGVICCRYTCAKYMEDESFNPHFVCVTCVKIIQEQVSSF